MKRRADALLAFALISCVAGFVAGGCGAPRPPGKKVLGPEDPAAKKTPSEKEPPNPTSRRSYRGARPTARLEADR